MVVHDFPAAKLFLVLLRQISKPITDFIKKKAIDRPIFRSYVCMPPAYFYNWCDVKVKMRMMDLGKPVKVPRLNETMAIDLGAQILGEAIIFLTAATLICVEYSRQVRNEERKEDMAKDELHRLNNKIDELNLQLQWQVSQIKGLDWTVHNLNNNRPHSSPLVNKMSQQKQESKPSDKHGTDKTTVPCKSVSTQTVEQVT